MTDWINIPGLQLLAVMVTGFIVGAFFLPLWAKSPIGFTLSITMLFYFVRFIPAYLELDHTTGEIIPGNGIVSAAIMYFIYMGTMQLGYVLLSRKYGSRHQDLGKVSSPDMTHELELRK